MASASSAWCASSTTPVSGDGRHVERRQAGQPPCAHDLLAIAAEFGNTAVDNLRTVLACYEAMRASDALTT